MSEQEFSNVLDLSGADTSGFDPIDPNRYTATVWEAEWAKTKPDATGAYGPNWPYINVQFKVEGAKLNGQEVGDRRVFAKYFPTAPQGYDPQKAAKSQGSFVNFLVGLGYKEEDIKKADFTINFEDWKGKPCVVVISRDAIPNTDPPVYTNNVKGVKTAGTDTTAAPASALL